MAAIDDYVEEMTGDARRCTPTCFRCEDCRHPIHQRDGAYNYTRWRQLDPSQDDRNTVRRFALTSCAVAKSDYLLRRVTIRLAAQIPKLGHYFFV